jgi:hypothetical protein
MDTLLNDLFRAKPDALLMIAGLAFLTIAVIGNVKTYIDPGKVGRIAAGGIGGILLLGGISMYRAAPASAAIPVVHAVAVARGSSGRTTTSCYVPGHWPSDIHKEMATGDSCSNAAGEVGKAVTVNPVCTYTSGPLTGTNQVFDHPMYVGYDCTSPDHGSKGSVLDPEIKHQ